VRRRSERVIDPDETYADAVVEHYWSLLTGGRCQVLACVVCRSARVREERA
jgi:hypothetical protein